MKTLISLVITILALTSISATFAEGVSSGNNYCAVQSQQNMSRAPIVIRQSFAPSSVLYGMSQFPLLFPYVGIDAAIFSAQQANR